MSQTPALVVLADGTTFSGWSFGAPIRSTGEVVFNTSMSGYQEILTDPSYRGQIVTMTSPHIGNTGVNELDVESDRVHVAGLVVRDVSRIRSSYRSTRSLQDYLVAAEVPGVTGVDTRALTRHIRTLGTTMGAIVLGAVPADVPEIVEAIQRAPQYDEIDYVSACSVSSPRWVGLADTGDPYRPRAVTLTETEPEGDGPLVVVVDYGVKRSILVRLAVSGAKVLVVPHTTPPAEILGRRPDGVLLSNGPGDPGRMDGAVAGIRGLLGQVPLFGICLGHQLLARALGGETFKLRFGHRGPNQPVLDAATGRVEITAQNHGYAVRFDADRTDVEITHRNLNDATVEGLAVPGLRAFSVQHHPEAGPGPNDATPMFARFRAAIAPS